MKYCIILDYMFTLYASSEHTNLPEHPQCSVEALADDSPLAIPTFIKIVLSQTVVTHSLI